MTPEDRPSPRSLGIALGDRVEIELARGIVVRDEITRDKLQTGSVVTWSTYYARRYAEGAITPRALEPEIDDELPEYEEKTDAPADAGSKE